MYSDFFLGNVTRELQNGVKNLLKKLKRIKEKLKNFKRNREKRGRNFLRYVCPICIQNCLLYNTGQKDIHKCECRLQVFPMWDVHTHLWMPLYLSSACVSRSS